MNECDYKMAAESDITLQHRMKHTKRLHGQSHSMNENIQFLQAFPEKSAQGRRRRAQLVRPGVANAGGLLPDKDNIVVELGVGTGAITKYVHEILPDNRSYLASRSMRAWFRR